MNSFERLFGRMRGEKVDRLPSTCLFMSFAAKLIGVPYGKYVSDYRLLSQGVLRCYEEFGTDMLCVISDPMREASGFGAKVIVPEDDVPFCRENLLKEISDIEKLKVIDPSKSARMTDRIMAVLFLKERAGGDVPVTGWVEGAVAESCDLMDMTEFMMNMLDYPEEIAALLDICTEQSERFALAQIEAGADIIGVGDAASSLIGPALYEEFALPYQQRLIKTIQNAGAKVKLHICGNLNPVLELVAQTGADIIDLDHMVDMRAAAGIFPKSSSICGNFDPVSVLLQGTPQDVIAAVKKCREIENLNNSIISAGCEVPKFTPVENVLAVAEGLL